MVTERATNLPRVTAWADGYGTWHVRVPRHAVSPIIGARHALRDELTAREGDKLAPEVWRYPVRVPELDTPGTLVYREADRATCRYCARGIVRVEERWIDPEASGDDITWRETCDAHDTFTAEHEPEEADR